MERTLSKLVTALCKFLRIEVLINMKSGSTQSKKATTSAAKASQSPPNTARTFCAGWQSIQKQN
jgi:hypothetical protein